MYYFLANNSESCPELSGERLLTTVAEGESFEGLSVIDEHSGDGDGGGGDYCGEDGEYDDGYGNGYFPLDRAESLLEF